jgi:predicted transposase YdaD
MAENTTIQVSRQARDHLAQVAKEHGMTLGQFVERLAAAQPTAEQIAERLAADRRVVRDVIGLEIGDAEFDRAPDVLGNIYKIAAEKVRTVRGAAT